LGEGEGGVIAETAMEREMEREIEREIERERLSWALVARGRRGCRVWRTVSCVRTVVRRVLTTVVCGSLSTPSHEAKETYYRGKREVPLTRAVCESPSTASSSSDGR
jgi:hypothetical protein